MRVSLEVAPGWRLVRWPVLRVWETGRKSARVCSVLQASRLFAFLLLFLLCVCVLCHVGLFFSERRTWKEGMELFNLARLLYHL